MRGDAPGAAPPMYPSPKASRLPKGRWLDPKLLLGVLLVLGSMALGGQVIGQANHTEPVLRAKENIMAGERITRDMVEETRVRFTSPEDAEKYVAPRAFKGQGIPKKARSTSYVRAGELLPIDAITTHRPGSVQRFAVAVPPGSLPKGLERGDRVDLWLVSKPDSASGGTATPGPETPEDGIGIAARNVQVIEVPREEDVAESSPSITLEVDDTTIGADGRTRFDLERFYQLQAGLQLRIHERDP